MQRDHPAILRVALLTRSAGRQFALMAARNLQFRQPLQANAAEQNQEPDGGQVHCSNSISALKPGPKAASKPRSPVLASPRVIHSFSTNSTEALYRLP